MTFPVLPDTLSGLITIALRDARSLDRERYLPHAREWHEPSNSHCLVCLSGAVMSVSFKASPRHPCTPTNFPALEMDKLFALNKVREGNWIWAWTLFYGSPTRRSLKRRLAALPAPSFSNFYSWPDFEAHLQSLERIVPRLRKIEDLAGLP